jgi:hypothetical protein
VKRLVTGVLLFTLAVPALAKTHRDTFNVSCDVLWAAVKDTLRNSGKYGIIGIDNGEKTASFNIGGGLAGKRINSVVLNGDSNSCEMQTQTAYSGLVHNDAGDFKERVSASLTKLQPAASAKPEASANQAAPGDSGKSTAGAALTNADVLKLKEAGLGEQLIIDKIKNSPAKFQLETNDIVQLKQNGLSDAIISAMMEASQRKN